MGRFFRRFVNIFLIALCIHSVCGYADVQPHSILVPASRAVIERDSAFVASFGFVDMSADTLIDPTGSLDGFRASLDRIALARHGEPPHVVSIVHYGDSHVQGGILTGSIMRSFARDYGTSGRGFITPHKLSGRNEPRDYTIASSAVDHDRAYVTQRTAELPIGVSGVAVSSRPGSSYRISVHDLPDDPTDYNFSRVVVFHDSLSPIITLSNESLMDDLGDDIFAPHTTPLNLLDSTSSVELLTYPHGIYARGPIYGFSLENDRSGVIYHSIGVNGACYLHWGRAPQVAAQSEALSPRLIIVSLGSNEAAGGNFIDAVFRGEVDSFVRKLRAANPSVPILLTTPPQVMRKKKPNANFERVRNVLAAYVQAEGLALFDLYGATGGALSALDWQRSRLLFRDGIHFNPDGYRLQGLLIYNALTRKWR